MTYNSIQAIKARHVTTISDPYNYGVEVRVRRAGHKKSIAAQRLDSSKQLAIAREIVAAQARLREAGADVPTNPGELAIVDEKFGAFIASVEEPDRDETEERAAAYVAGWGGAPFDEGSLPTNGAFTLAAVRHKFFGAFGSYDEDEVYVLPRYMRTDTMEFVSDQATLGEIHKLREQYAEQLEAALTEPNRDDFEDAGAYLRERIDWMSAERTEEREEKVRELEASHTAALANLNIKETPYGGRPVREAMALIIIDAAVELENSYREDTGFLSKSSPRSSGSKASSQKRTRTKRRKPARRRG